MADDKWPEWVVRYTFDDGEYGLTIPARDAKEASRRLRAIGMTGKVDGELAMTIPARPGAGLFVRALVFFRNLFFGGNHA